MRFGWRIEGGAMLDYVLLRTNPATGVTAAAAAARHGDGNLELADPDVLPGRSYSYVLEGHLSATGEVVYRGPETLVIVPEEPATSFTLALDVRTPARRGDPILFSLPQTGPATLLLHDVRGKRVATMDAGESGAVVERRALEVDDVEGKPDASRGALHHRELLGSLRVGEYRHLGNPWEHLLHELKALGGHRRLHGRHAGHPASRSREAGNIACRDGVKIDRHSDDRRIRACRDQSRESGLCGATEKRVAFELREIRGERGQPIESVFRITALDYEILAFSQAQLAEPLEEGDPMRIVQGCGIDRQHAEAVFARRRLGDRQTRREQRRP